MIKWLLPLGLLGLSAILALVIIYIIKPRFQQKFLSSTVIWRTLLKRHRKKIPVQPIKSILVFLCQALAITAIALIMSDPKYFSEDFVVDESEKIVILDASASMRAKFTNSDKAETRFERAVREIRLHIDEWLMDDDGTLSIIVAGKDAQYAISDATKREYSDIVDALDTVSCTYGVGDMQGALDMAQERLSSNPAAKIIVYSGTDFGNLGSAVTMRNLANIENEWNIGILGCTVSIEENEYVFNVEVGAFGRVSEQRELVMEIKGADNGDSVLNLPQFKIPVTFDVNSDSFDYSDTQVIKLRATDKEIGGNEEWYFSSYDEVKLSFSDLHDSIAEDDEMMVYGGKRDEVNVQYYSSKPNIFYYLGFLYLRDPLNKTREINYEQAYSLSEIKKTGYDFYIFEHTLPSDIKAGDCPKDGVLILSDPDDLTSYGITLGENVSLGKLTYFEGVSHSLLQYMQPSEIGVTSYRKILSYDEEYEPILFCNGDPVMLVKNTEEERIVVMPFSMNLSNFPSTAAMTTFVFNLIQTYMPLTLDEYLLEADGKVNLGCKGSSITVTDPSGKEREITEFPAEEELSLLGTYTFTTNYSFEKESEVRKAFVHIPSSESGLFRVTAMDIKLNNVEVWEELGTDLFLYFAIVLTVLVTVEWCLQFKDIC